MAQSMADDDRDDLYERPDPQVLERAHNHRNLERLREMRRRMTHTEGHVDCPACAYLAEPTVLHTGPACPSCGRADQVERLRDDRHLCGQCNVTFDVALPLR